MAFGCIGPSKARSFENAKFFKPETMSAAAAESSEAQPNASEGKVVMRTIYYVRRGQMQSMVLETRSTGITREPEESDDEEGNGGESEDATTLAKEAAAAVAAAAKAEEDALALADGAAKEAALAAATSAKAAAQALVVKAEDATLAASLTVAYNECDAEVKRLAAGNGEKNAPLYELWRDMEKSPLPKPAEGAEETDLRYVRVVREFDGFVNGWKAPAILNMTDPDQRKKFPPEVLAHYAALEPRESKLRMLVLENMFYSKELHLIVLQRLFANFAPYNPVDSTQQVAPSERAALTEKSIVFSHTAYGLSAFEDTAADPVRDPEKYKQKMLRVDKAHDRYTKKRQDQRRRLLAANMPLVSDFIILLYAAELVRRIDAAKPHVPERLLVRVPVEKCGQVVDVDNIISVTQADILKHLAEAQKIEAESAEALKKLSDSKDSNAIQHANQIYQNNRLVTTRTNQLAESLATIHGDRQIMLHVVEKGRGQDEAIDVDILYALTIPYALLRQKLAHIRAALEAAAAEQAATQEAPAQETPPQETAAQETPAAVAVTTPS